MPANERDDVNACQYVMPIMWTLGESPKKVDDVQTCQLMRGMI